MQVLKNEIGGKDGVKKFAVIILTAVTGAIGMNMFLIPAGIFSAGANGLAQIISRLFAENLNMNVDTGFLILILNIPIALLGLKIGSGNLADFINTLGNIAGDYDHAKIEIRKPLMASIVEAC